MEIKNTTGNSNKKTLLFLGLGTLIILLMIKVVSGNLPSAEDLQTFFDRLPYILIGNQQGWAIKGGFAMNIFISLMSMLLGSVVGILLGLAQLAPQKIIRGIA